MDIESRKGWLLGFGHPLLDLTATVDVTFLRKYNLEKNNAILANADHEPLCADLAATYDVLFTAGGSTQNAIRVAQFILKEPKCTTFLGTIGNDHYGKLLRGKILEDGVEGAYVLDKDCPTGKCAVMLTDGGKNRSLVSFHGAARNFNCTDVYQRWPYVKMSRVIYSAGFTIAANYDAVMELATHVAAQSDLKKVFAFNLSAPYVCTNHIDRLVTLLPLVDILFGNENEAKAISQALKWQESDLMAIAGKLAQSHNPKKSGRIVIITNGPDPVIVANNDGTGSVKLKTYNVPTVADEERVDTNGAGDAFVGGFLGKFVSKLTLDKDGRIMVWNDLLGESINCAIDCATKMIKVIGCDLIAFKCDN